MKVLLSKNRTCCPSQRGWPAPSATLPGFVASNHSFQNISILSLTLLVCNVHFPWKMRAPIFFTFLFLFLLCEATNFFFSRTRINAATMPYGIEAKHSHCESLHAQITLLKLLQRDNRERQLFSRCPARKPKICFTSPPAPLYNCICLSTFISANSNSSNQDSPFNFFVFASHNSLSPPPTSSALPSPATRKKHILTVTSPPS